MADANELAQSRMWGKLLGEVYRIQRKLGMPCDASEGKIYGLLHGIERSLNDEAEVVGSIPDGLLKQAEELVSKYENDPEMLKSLTGYCDLEGKFACMGVERGVAGILFTYWKASGQFDYVIAKIEHSQHTPAELKDFSMPIEDLST